jgi:hypothetical protein
MRFEHHSAQPLAIAAGCFAPSAKSESNLFPRICTATKVLAFICEKRKKKKDIVFASLNFFLN